MTKKKQVGVRFDSNRTRLKTGETQRPNGTYAYRWSTPDGKRHSIYCAVDIAGATVTEKREQSVKAHICQSNRLGYYLIKRTADASQMAAEIKTLFIRNHIYLHTDSEKDVQVLRERFLEWKYRNACKLNGKY